MLKPETEGNNGGHHSRVSPRVSPEIVGVAGKKEEGGGFARRKEKVGEPTVASTSAVAVAYLAGDRRNPPIVVRLTGLRFWWLDDGRS